MSRGTRSGLEWAHKLSRARAECRALLIERLHAARSSAEVKAIHHLLYALDRRFREDRAGSAPGIVVQLIPDRHLQGRLEAEVIDVRQLPPPGAPDDGVTNR